MTLHPFLGLALLLVPLAVPAASAHDCFSTLISTQCNGLSCPAPGPHHHQNATPPVTCFRPEPAPEASPAWAPALPTRLLDGATGSLPLP